jgi:hypothetical protein
MENEIAPAIDTSQPKPKASTLFKQSFNILNGDKELMLFPICSTVFSVLEAIVIGIVFFVFDTTVVHGKSSIIDYVFLFVYYLAIYYTAIYFNVGLAASVLKKFQDGKSPKFRYGLQQANAHRGTIFGYAMIAATVGLLLHILASGRRNIIGKIIANLVAAVWSIATIFIAPVIVTTNLSPIEAIKFSAKVFKSTWGNTFKGMLGFFLFWLLGTILVLIPAAVGFLLQSPDTVIAGIGISLIGIILVSVLISTCTAIFRTALYHYATTKQVPSGFDGSLPMAVH